MAEMFATTRAAHLAGEAKSASARAWACTYSSKSAISR